MAPSQSKIKMNQHAAELTEYGIALERLDAGKTTTGGGEKKKRREVKMVAATQNMRGLTTESDREEIKLQMGRQGMHVVCGQETWMQDEKAMERWDSGELFINCGGQEKRKHEGVCFFLSKTAAKRFEQGGRRLKKYCSRLATIRLQIHAGRDLYIVNAHAPDSGQPAAKREAFSRRLEAALQAEKHSDIMVVMGDFNASTGVAENDSDEVSGKYGLPHVNDAGRNLKMLAAMFQLQDLLTFEEQQFYGSWVHSQSEKWHQIDKVFMKEKHRYMVNKCVNGEMLKVSDHFSVRLNLSIFNPAKPMKTTRQKRNGKAIGEFFGKHAEQETRDEQVLKIANEYEKRLKNGGDTHANLMAAVTAVVDELPNKKRTTQGWCDVNMDLLNAEIEERNSAARTYAKTKTAEAKRVLQLARAKLKKLKIVAKNEWMLQQLQECNESVLPGKGDRKNPYALWKMATKLQRGLDKWKSWDDSMVRNKRGEMASTPEENATVFQDFFNELFSNDTQGGDVDQEYEKMKKREVDRMWVAPTEGEMMATLKNMKNTAAGVSGITAAVWQACGENAELRKGMLQVLQECWEKECVPQEWAVFHMTVLFKKGKRDEVGNYRGISMAETLSKLYTSILKSRLEGLYEELVPEYCNGFRSGRGRHDSIYMLKETLRKRKAKGLDSYCIFYDFVKCFDKISRDCIWKSMQVMGVDPKMIRAVKATLENTECKMTIGGIEKTVQMAEGSGQGTTLGPTLCNFFFLPLLMQFERKMADVQTTAMQTTEGHEDERFGTFTHNFADDTCMLVGSHEDASRVAEEFNRHTRLFRSRVHVATDATPVSKSVAVYIPAKKGTTRVHDRIWVNKEKTEWINYVEKSV